MVRLDELSLRDLQVLLDIQREYIERSLERMTFVQAERKKRISLPIMKEFLILKVKIPRMMRKHNRILRLHGRKMQRIRD